MRWSRKRIFFIVAVVTLCIVGYGLYAYATTRPEYLASHASRIPDFFGISSASIGSDEPNFCSDEMHSQGRNFEDFGSAGYSFHVPIQYGFLSDELYRHPKSSVNDSTLVITVQRGNILGVLTVSFDTGEGHVIYNQIYD